MLSTIMFNFSMCRENKKIIFAFMLYFIKLKEALGSWKLEQVDVISGFSRPNWYVPNWDRDGIKCEWSETELIAGANPESKPKLQLLRLCHWKKVLTR